MTKRERTRKVWQIPKGVEVVNRRGQTIQWPKEKGQEKFDRQHNDLKRRGLDNTMTKRERTEKFDNTKGRIRSRK